MSDLRRIRSTTTSSSTSTTTNSFYFLSPSYRSYVQGAGTRVQLTVANCALGARTNEHGRSLCVLSSTSSTRVLGTHRHPVLRSFPDLAPLFHP
eukprot:3633457-Rhodomonas_salina.4